MRNDRPSAHNNLGLSYFENDDFEEALIHYKKAIDLEPSSVHYNNRGLAFYHFDKLEEAAQDFEKAIELDPQDSTIYFNLGNVYLNWKKPIKDSNGREVDKFDEAIFRYDRALDIKKDNVKVLHAKGLTYQGKAELHKKKMSEIKELSHQDKEYLTQVYMELNQKAINGYKEALSVQEDFVSSRFHLGLIYHRINNFHEALKCFSKVLINIKDDKTVYIARGVVY